MATLSCILGPQSVPALCEPLRRPYILIILAASGGPINRIKIQGVTTEPMTGLPFPCFLSGSSADPEGHRELKGPVLGRAGEGKRWRIWEQSREFLLPAPGARVLGSRLGEGNSPSCSRLRPSRSAARRAPPRRRGRFSAGSGGGTARTHSTPPGDVGSWMRAGNR